MTVGKGTSKPLDSLNAGVGNFFEFVFVFEGLEISVSKQVLNENNKKNTKLFLPSDKNESNRL